MEYAPLIITLKTAVVATVVTFFLGIGLALAQARLQPQVVVIAIGGHARRRVVAAIARQRLADAVLQVRVALEAELLAELDHRGLAHAQRAGQLLGGVVAQQLGVVEDEVGDAPFDGRHLFAFGADFYQRWHGRMGVYLLMTLRDCASKRSNASLPPLRAAQGRAGEG